MDSFSDYKLQKNMSIKECASELEEDPKGQYMNQLTSAQTNNTPINHL